MSGKAKAPTEPFVENFLQSLVRISSDDIKSTKDLTLRLIQRTDHLYSFVQQLAKQVISLHARLQAVEVLTGETKLLVERLNTSISDYFGHISSAGRPVDIEQQKRAIFAIRLGKMHLSPTDAKGVPKNLDADLSAISNYLEFRLASGHTMIGEPYDMAYQYVKWRSKQGDTHMS